MRRRDFLRTALAGGGLASFQLLPSCVRGPGRDAPATAATGASHDRTREPIIDVHMHAYPADIAIPASAGNPATGRPPGVADGEQHLQACLAAMKRLNIVKGVVSGGDGDRLAAAVHWHDAAPDRIIPA